MLKVKNRLPKAAFFWLGVLLPFSSFGAETSKEGNSSSQIAIIIDDMGNSATVGGNMVDLPYPLTLSFLPYRRFSIAQANRAHMQGKEVMLHAPMESLHLAALGKGALRANMSHMHVVSALQSQLKAIPHVAGVNNHMGSALTQNRVFMDWFMAELSEYPLFFVDSRTTAETVAAKLSREHQIPTLERDVFLDHVITKLAITEQFERLINIAQTKGYAVAIGHPHPETLEILKEQLPNLSEQGIRLVSVSELMESIHGLLSNTAPNAVEPAQQQEAALITKSRLVEP